MYSITLANDAKTLQAAFTVRKVVFVDEQGVAPELEYDGYDPECTHLVLWCGAAVVGTVRLLPLPTGVKLGRLAVLPAHRGKGWGGRLLQAALEQARKQGYAQVKIHAQVHAVPFYKRYGFQVTSKEFLEAGISHVCMEAAIAWEGTGGEQSK
ncbi:MAG TPA: GNAT family N-acetyltransferase [Firmicutes bacterium]|nr:GNAT family N-acetyltransferase [Bacillota bacterium]